MLVQDGRRCEYLAGEWLVRQGGSDDWLVALVAGRAMVRFADSDGADVALAIRGPGDLLGEFAGLDSGPRSASVWAMEPCVGYVIPEARFVAWVRRNGLSSAVERYVLAKLRESAAPTWQAARHGPARRLAQLFAAVVDAAGPDHPDPTTVPMSQDDLATALGLAPMPLI